MASKQTKAKPTHLKISYSIHLIRVWSAARYSSVADISVPIEDISMVGVISKTEVSSATQASLTLIHWPANCFSTEVNRSLLCLQTSLPPHRFILKQERKQTPNSSYSKNTLN